jgi:hypothetical protein
MIWISSGPPGLVSQRNADAEVALSAIAASRAAAIPRPNVTMLVPPVGAIATTCCGDATSDFALTRIGEA